MYYPLHKGDKIGLVSPSRYVTEQEISKGVEYLRSLGFNPVMGKNAFKSFRFMAGTPAERTSDIMGFFLDPEIKAIFATSGGDGSQYILPLLDFEKIKQNPKPLWGFSDTTALQNALVEKCSLICPYGLTLNYDFRSGVINQTLSESVSNMIFGNDFCYAYGQSVIQGTAEGKLVGGCLSLLRNLCGTPYFPSLDGAILLVEDEQETTYKLDLMLQQISQCKDFDKLKGIIFGRFFECTIRRESDGTIDDVIAYFAKQLSIPVIKDFPMGHEFKRVMLPLGANVKITSTAQGCEVCSL